jgi:hypothetical protein
MVAKFQWAVTFFRMFFFQSVFCIVFVLKMGKNYGNFFLIFSQDGAIRPRGWSELVFLP